ncbi:hypothetical protein A2U01_0119598, partial [Trifolium medium]|nr:hypothetical protein [Trifolium medium]
AAEMEEGECNASREKSADKATPRQFENLSRVVGQDNVVDKTQSLDSPLSPLDPATQCEEST